MPNLDLQRCLRVRKELIHYLSTEGKHKLETADVLWLAGMTYRLEELLAESSPVEAQETATAATEYLFKWTAGSTS